MFFEVLIECGAFISYVYRCLFYPCSGAPQLIGRNFNVCCSHSFHVLKAMIIIAWNGTLADIFADGVFKEVLSIFITAAVLKLGQGKMKKVGLLIIITDLYYYAWFRLSLVVIYA